MKNAWFLLHAAFLGCLVLLAIFMGWSAYKSHGFTGTAGYGNDLILGAWIVGFTGLVAGASLWRTRTRGLRVRPLLLVFALLFAAFVTLNQGGKICEMKKAGTCEPVLDYLLGRPGR